MLAGWALLVIGIPLIAIYGLLNRQSQLSVQLIGIESFDQIKVQIGVPGHKDFKMVYPNKDGKVLLGNPIVRTDQRQFIVVWSGREKIWEGFGPIQGGKIHLNKK